MIQRLCEIHSVYWTGEQCALCKYDVMEANGELPNQIH